LSISRLIFKEWICVLPVSRCILEQLLQVKISTIAILHVGRFCAVVAGLFLKGISTQI
jgi:hypothetical protein